MHVILFAIIFTLVMYGIEKSIVRLIREAIDQSQVVKRPLPSIPPEPPAKPDYHKTREFLRNLSFEKV